MSDDSLIHKDLKNLQNVDFRRVKNLREITFNDQNKQIQGANFSGLNLSGFDFSNANIQGANFSEAILNNTKFIDAKIQGTNFSNATLTEADFNHATAGLTRLWLFGLSIGHCFLCLVSTFTSIISITFFVRFFNAYNRRISCSSPILIAIIAFSIIVNLRTFVYGQWMEFSVDLGIYAIVVVFLLALVTAIVTENKKDVGSFIIAGLFLFCILGITKYDGLIRVFAGWEENKLQFLKPFIHNFGHGKWLAMVVASITGGSFGSWFSQSAISKNGRFNWLWNFYLKIATLKGTLFKEADLTDATFESAKLNGANFEGAVIIRTYWQGVKYLENANVGDKYLKYPQIRRLLTSENTTKLRNMYFEGINNLEGINLDGKNLSGAIFCEINLRKATLRNAILNSSNLEGAKLEGTNLSNASLTGAILRGWSIDRETILSGIQCDFVLLEKLPGENENRKRYPARGNFNPGEFEKHYSTNDIGVMKLEIPRDFNERAFRSALEQSIQGNHYYQLRELEISGNDVIVKIKVPNDIDPNDARDTFDRIYTREKMQADSNRNDTEENNRRISLFDIVRVFNRMGGKIIFDHRTVNLHGNGIVYIEKNNGTVQ